MLFHLESGFEVQSVNWFVILYISVSVRLDSDESNFSANVSTMLAVFLRAHNETHKVIKLKCIFLYLCVSLCALGKIINMVETLVLKLLSISQVKLRQRYSHNVIMTNQLTILQKT